MRRPRAAVLALLAAVCYAAAQPRPAPKELAKITAAWPVAVAAGATTKLTLRGLNLEKATGLRVHEPKSAGRLLRAGPKVGAPDAKQLAYVGDTQAEVEVTVPADSDGVPVPIAVLTPAGEGPPYRLVVDSQPATAEKEPNNGFGQAQPVTLPTAVEGRIAGALDVDVFRFEGRTGRRLVAEVFAARCGAPTDPRLVLYDTDGRILASDDDGGPCGDARLEVVLPRTASYLLAVSDAHDAGGPAHVYRLVIRER